MKREGGGRDEGRKEEGGTKGKVEREGGGRNKGGKRDRRV